MREGCEILIDEPIAKRGRRMLEAMAATAPAGSVVTAAYRGSHRMLMVYGAGRPNRMAALDQQRARGGRTVVWDLGYWDRDEAMRLAVDRLHPTSEQLAAAPAGSRGHFVLREDADPEGPILLVGLGTKSAALYGLRPMEWERRTLAKLKARAGGRAIAWRPKGRLPSHLPGAVLRHGVPIEQALKGCSLVVCRHSNVAVDACIAGVPVQCEDGAAAALYRHGTAPAVADRTEFLRRLGWWNWKPSEAAQAWQWIERVCECG